MSITIELTPGQERILAALARQRRVTVEAYLEGALSGKYPLPSFKKPSEILADLERKGVIPIWTDRPEDSPELARKLRQGRLRGIEE